MLRQLTASIILLFITSVALATTPPNMQHSLAPMLKKVMPTVVNIQVEGEMALPADLARELYHKQLEEGATIPLIRKFAKAGSGVVVDAKKGYILTNAHVVKDGKTITVHLNDDVNEPAKLIGLDAESDIAVIQIKPHHLKQAVFGNSDKLEVGDYVVAIGNPFGLSQTVTSGIVSALKRNDLNIEGFENFIQTDAAINPGNSGGALVNTKGQLIGINTAIVSTAGGNNGIGFAIPIDMARSIMEQLIKYGKVERGVLGVFGQAMNPKLAKAFDIKDDNGVVVTAVSPSSAAAKAGLKTGDIILTVNNEKVSNPYQLRNVIGLVRAGNKISMKVLRDGKTKIISTKITAAHLQEHAAEAQAPYFFGVALRDVKQRNANQTYANGVEVVDMQEDTNAYRAGLMPGDIIISANKHSVSDLAQLHSLAIAAKKANRALLLNVVRGPGALFVVIEP
tara:strand:+ start:20847 stop:22202 length:1356 start_codon:yes stop_codon:yes gene_type:complete